MSPSAPGMSPLAPREGRLWLPGMVAKKSHLAPGTVTFGSFGTVALGSGDCRLGAPREGWGFFIIFVFVLFYD